MTPEEEFNQEVWQVLQKIRKAELATVGKHIEYKFPHIVGVGIIPKEKQKKILYKLQEWDALKIRENPWEPPESTPDTFYLNLIQPKFNESYDKFQKACDLTSYLNDFQGKALSSEEKSKFSQVDQKQTNIDKWLDTKEDWTLRKIWQVVSALNSEWQLQDEKAFNMPHDKFQRARITANKDLEAILKSLHKQKVICVSRKEAETPPTNDPDKPQGSLWVTVVDEPDIVLRTDTLVEIFPDEFTYLRNTLQKKLSKEPKVKSGDLKSRYQQLLNEIRKPKHTAAQHSQQGEQDTNTIISLQPGKRDLRKKVNNIIKTTKLGKKARLLLRFFAKDFEPKTIKEIVEETKSKAAIKLISAVREKLNGTEFSIKTNKGSFSRETTYELIFLPTQKSV